MLPLYLIDRISLAAFAAILIVGALSDARTLRIPNLLTIAVVCLFPVHAFCSPSPTALVYALLAGATAFAIGAFSFSRGWMGGGDVKLLAACTLWAGTESLPIFVLVTGLVGGILSVLAISRYGLALAVAFDRAGLPQCREILDRQVVPYGIAIAAGGVTVAFHLASLTY